jgi:CHASE1-domain containing sensor protein
MRGEFDDHRWALTCMQSFFSASVAVERDEFRVFVAPFLRDNPDILVLFWAPRVAAAERAALETIARQEGLAEFACHELDTEGRPSVLGQRAHYYPIFYAEHTVHGPASFGFDLGSTEDRDQALQEAAALGVERTFARPILYGSERLAGFRSVMPVHSSGTPGAGDGEHTLQGFVGGIFRIDTTLDEALSPLQRHRIDFQLIDRDADHAIVATRTNPRGAEASDPFGLRRQFAAEFPLAVGGRNWAVLCSSTTDYFIGGSALPLVLLACGLFMTA